TRKCPRRIIPQAHRLACGLGCLMGAGHNRGRAVFHDWRAKSKRNAMCAPSLIQDGGEDVSLTIYRTYISRGNETTPVAPGSERISARYMNTTLYIVHFLWRLSVLALKKLESDPCSPSREASPLACGTCVTSFGQWS